MFRAVRVKYYTPFDLSSVLRIPRKPRSFVAQLAPTSFADELITLRRLLRPEFIGM